MVGRFYSRFLPLGQLFLDDFTRITGSLAWKRAMRNSAQISRGLCPDISDTKIRFRGESKFRVDALPSGRKAAIVTEAGFAAIAHQFKASRDEGKAHRGRLLVGSTRISA